MLVKERLNELEKELNEFSTSEDLQASDIELEEHVSNVLTFSSVYIFKHCTSACHFYS